MSDETRQDPGHSGIFLITFQAEPDKEQNINCRAHKGRDAPAAFSISGTTTGRFKASAPNWSNTPKRSGDCGEGRHSVDAHDNVFRVFCKEECGADTVLCTEWEYSLCLRAQETRVGDVQRIIKLYEREVEYCEEMAARWAHVLKEYKASKSHPQCEAHALERMQHYRNCLADGRRNLQNYRLKAEQGAHTTNTEEA